MPDLIFYGVEAIPAQTVIISGGDILFFIFGKSQSVTLAFGNVAGFAFKVSLAAWTVFYFMRGHGILSFVFANISTWYSFNAASSTGRFLQNDKAEGKNLNINYFH